MENFLFKTKGNAQPRKDQPKVFFTCHPNDFDKYFNSVCQAVFKSHDCIIYYLENYEKAESKRTQNFNQFNLFIVPVTLQLLNTENVALNVDLKFAKDNNFPILPLMMQAGIDEVYGRADKFGERQYLTPDSSDLSEIKFDDKLKKYLDGVLLSNEMIERIRQAFSARIFLSYRKMDRAYANTLISYIHSLSFFSDVAIWYDEFLTPGESFNENIEKELINSDLCILLVTPNLLKDSNGKPNYIIQTEYPLAVKYNVPVIAIEMQETDDELLKSAFEGLEPAVEFSNESALFYRLITGLNKPFPEDDPWEEASFLIGMAYLNGVDMPIDFDLAIEHLTKAGESGNLEAIDTLCFIYEEGIVTQINYDVALYWRKTLVSRCIECFGEKHLTTIDAYLHLGILYGNAGYYQLQLKTLEKAYRLSVETLGENHRETIYLLNNLCYAYGNVGEYQKQLEIAQKAHELCKEILGEESIVTISCLINLALAYGNVGDYNKKLQINEQTYLLSKRILGEEHNETLIALNNLALSYGNVDDFQKQLDLNEKVVELNARLFGKEHPNTIIALNNLATSYTNVREFDKALKLSKKVYNVSKKVLGKEHPKTILTLANLATCYGNVGDYQNQLKFNEQAYALSKKVLGENHPDTLALKEKVERQSNKK